jgi:hypothetical protein
MLISKMQTYLSDKGPPQKVKIKNEKTGLSKIKKRFLTFNFLGILSQRQVCFFEISIKFSHFWAFCHKDKFAFLKSA